MLKLVQTPETPLTPEQQHEQAFEWIERNAGVDTADNFGDLAIQWAMDDLSLAMRCARVFRGSIAHYEMPMQRWKSRLTNGMELPIYLALAICSVKNDQAPAHKQVGIGYARAVVKRVMQDKGTIQNNPLPAKNNNPAYRAWNA